MYTSEREANNPLKYILNFMSCDLEDMLRSVYDL